MKKTKLFFAALAMMVGAFSGSAFAATVDTAYFIGNTDTSQILVVVRSTTSGTTFKVAFRDTSISFSNAATVENIASLPIGTTTDTITSVGLIPNTTYYYLVWALDGASSDSMIVSNTTLFSPPGPMDVANMLASNITQTGAQLSVDFDSHNSNAYIDWQRSTDGGATWNTIAFHTGLNGFSTDSLMISQSPGTTVLYMTRGWNDNYPGQPDTANIVSVTTYSLNAQPPMIDTATISGVNAWGGALYVVAHSDSVGTTTWVDHSLDNWATFTTDTIIATPAPGSFNFWWWFDIPFASTDVWARVITLNSVGGDTVYLHFVTSPTVVLAPWMDQPSVNVMGAWVTVDAPYFSNDVWPNTLAGFEIMDANDTTGSIYNSGIDTVVASDGTLHFVKTFGPLPDGYYAVHGWIFNTIGFYSTPFTYFTILTSTITEVPKVMLPHRVEIFDAIGRHIGSEIMEDEVLYMKTRNDLPSGMYILRSEEFGGRKVVR